MHSSILSTPTDKLGVQGIVNPPLISFLLNSTLIIAFYIRLSNIFYFSEMAETSKMSNGINLPYRILVVFLHYYRNFITGFTVFKNNY